MLKWSWFDLLCITFYDLPFTSLRETWSFARWLFIWNLSGLCPSVTTGDSSRFLGRIRGGNGVTDQGPSLQAPHRDDNCLLQMILLSKLWTEAIQEYKSVFRCYSGQAYMYWFLYNFDLLPLLVITTESIYVCFRSMQIYFNFTFILFPITGLFSWVWLSTRASRLLHKVANTILLAC